jgi:hypothetical protein
VIKQFNYNFWGYTIDAFQVTSIHVCPCSQFTELVVTVDVCSGAQWSAVLEMCSSDKGWPGRIVEESLKIVFTNFISLAHRL